MKYALFTTLQILVQEGEIVLGMLHCYPVKKSGASRHYPKHESNLVQLP
jgi:hypothetical protein